MTPNLIANQGRR